MILAIIILSLVIFILACTLMNAVDEVRRLQGALQDAYARMHMVKSSLHSQCLEADTTVSFRKLAAQIITTLGE